MASIDPGYSLTVKIPPGARDGSLFTIQRTTFAEMLAEVGLIEEASNGGNIFAAHVVEALYPPNQVIPEAAATNVIKAQFGATEEAPAETAAAAPADQGCPNKKQCGQPLSAHKFVPAGVSKKTGKPYNAFSACPD